MVCSTSRGLEFPFLPSGLRFAAPARFARIAGEFQAVTEVSSEGPFGSTLEAIYARLDSFRTPAFLRKKRSREAVYFGTPMGPSPVEEPFLSENLELCYYVSVCSSSVK